MTSFAIVTVIYVILLLTWHNPTSYASEQSNDDLSVVPESTASSFPNVVLNGIHNATAKIVMTSPVGLIPAKTWISFGNGPMVEIDDELTPESIEAAYNKTVGKSGQASGLLEPFSFESPFVDPVCVFNGTIVKADVTGPTTISCQSPAIDRTQGAGVPLRISSNGGHDLTSLDTFVYLAAQDRGTLLLEPNHGPSSGGTRVHVRGITSGAIVGGPLALCKFGNHISYAIEVGLNGEFVLCLSPSRSKNGHAVTVPVDVSMLGQSSVFSGEQVVFRYDEDIAVSSLNPSSGVVIGGTQVNICGGPFHNPDEIVCRFGKKTVDAIYHDVTAISCISPYLDWIEEVQRVSIFTMAANPEIQTISATVEDYVNEIHICQTFGANLDDDESGRGFRLVAPGGSIEYPLTHHTRWIHHNESADGMREALIGTGLFVEDTLVGRTGPFLGKTYIWEIVLPKDETFNGQTLHVVDFGGGAVQLKGDNASVTCTLAQRGTSRLGGEFRLQYSNNGSVETSRLLPHNSTEDDIKVALEELRGIDVVHVQSTNLDINMTGSGAVQWHVTFDSLKNAGDVPLLSADYTSNGTKLLGSNATINIIESRKGASHAIYKIEIPAEAEEFCIVVDGIESQFLLVGATPSEVVEAIDAIGGKSIVVEKDEAEYFFLDIIGYSLEGRLKAHIILCSSVDSSSSCSTEIHSAILHAPSTAKQLGGHFSLRFQPNNIVPCKTCVHSITEPISAFASVQQIETALQRLDFVDGVVVSITESDRNGEYKIPVTSGIVGMNRNIYVRFIQTKAHPWNIDERLYSTGYSGDVPLLEINQDNLKGTPTRESANSNDYIAIVSEVVKGTDANHGGIVQVAVSINSGADFSEQNPLFEYKPVPILHSIIPAYGSIAGNTSIRVKGDNFSRKSARFCLFWGLGASVVDGAPSGLIEYVPVSKYATGITDNATITEIVCVSPAALKPQYVNLVVVSDNDVFSLESSVKGRGKLFRYHKDIKISNIYPASASVTGNVSVSISGGPFFSKDGLYCRFGGVFVPGVFYNPNHISCDAPLHASGTYALEVTQNGQDFTTSGYTFRYYHTCSVGSISPSSGPARKSGTNIKVVGENFVNTTHLQCRFGLASVPATFVRSTEIFCSSPPVESSSLSFVHFPGFYPQLMKGKIVSLEVSSNGQDFTSNGVQFLYLEDIKKPCVAMSELQIFVTGTPVIIRGNNFVNSTLLACRFRHEITRAFFLTQEAVLCFLPSVFGQTLMSNTEKSFPLAVSNNAADFLYVSGINSTSNIRSGMYQPGREVNTLLSCPRGTACDGSLLGNNFTLCNPGTYQPLPGQSACIHCPIGYVCNEFGMTVPRICPAHFLCDVRGLASAKPCPTNYICDRGTATLVSACVNALDVGSEICFDNSTDDFGLQSSKYPSQVWAERHLMPLDTGSPVAPIRGRYCFDTTCINHEDSDNFQVFDTSFDYSSTGFRLRRPKCIEGTGCDPGILPSARMCSKGHYCRFGVKRQCTVGTYCPHDNLFDPLPCEPGTFNFMVGQEKCSECPSGYFCPNYGLLSPVICPPGFVCSKSGLRSPNIRCPAGFYCHNGTKTSDPFRNDTTLRPYACSPGTFCLAGTGSNEIREDVFGFAQPCTAGFFCEAASTSAKGSGACPPSFECTKGTANPRPTPKGFHAEHPGTIESTACLPGFYAPTIQTNKCYECPPGTSCSFEGLFEAEECGPGTYRSTDEEGGNSCVPCPPGTWSKNWGLREEAECTRCPTGTICPVDGMTQPCSHADLPTPFEPVVNFQGLPEFEYMFPADSRPLPFSMEECLELNSVRDKSTRPQYFFGELIPPYIDILGRGPHFRHSDQNSLKFQSVAKCYKNFQPHGSLLYMRMSDYYGPQYDIQTGYPHQGYGVNFLYNQIYATAPPKGYDFSFSYFRGKGNGHIDLPKARIHDPAFNCTKGIQLMNSSLVIRDARQIVYTDSANDFEGGYDIKKCPYFDSVSSCYIADHYAAGECCNISKYEQRAIYLAHDQFYTGTCEADLICSEGGSAPSQAKPCEFGFVCDEKTSSDSSMNYPCPAGFVCDFATTPDTKLRAPGSQLKNLCREGYFCKNDGNGRQRQEVCPEGFWCPSGTSDPHFGSLANDGLLRLLRNFRESRITHLRYRGGDTFVLLDDHSNCCDGAIHSSLETRFQSIPQDYTNMNHLQYLSGQNKVPITVNEATQLNEKCARDHKSGFIRDSMRRNECNCYSQFLTLASVYRLWKCTSNSPLDDLGLGDVVVPPTGSGNRDFWHRNSRIHLDFGSADLSRDKNCVFNDSMETLTLTEGRLPDENELPNISTLHKHYSNYLDLRRIDGFQTRITYARSKYFESYELLRHEISAEFRLQSEQISSGTRHIIDPHTFDVYQSIRLIEQFGQRLESLIYLNATDQVTETSIELAVGHVNNAKSTWFDFVAPLDWCECQNLLRCPNGTSSSEGSIKLSDCVSTKNEVLHRITLLPPVFNSTTSLPSTVLGTVDESKVLALGPFDVAILTIDQSRLPRNMTYGDHYQISIYDACKPCPIQYQCQTSECRSPVPSEQYDLLNECLKQHRKNVCLRVDGSQEDVNLCQSQLENRNSTLSDQSILLFSEPDLEKCLSRPYFCSEMKSNFLSFRRLCQDKLENNKVSPIYDCSDVSQWHTYSRWRNEVCCSVVPELRGIETCSKHSVCTDNPLIEKIIREKLIGVFESKYGFNPPVEQKQGQLLMNRSLQEDIDNARPIDLFNKHFGPENEMESTKSRTFRGCCECRRHPMPAFFESNKHVSGFPDDKHQPAQLAISALARVELTIVVELLHGAYYTDFRNYFGAMNKSMIRVHTPGRFAENAGVVSTWMAVIQPFSHHEKNFDLPLNLPLDIKARTKPIIENRFLVDRPSNTSIGDRRTFGTNALDADSERRHGIISSHPTRDPTETVLHEKQWWPHDFLALPYLPFFSNCDGYDSHIGISRLLEEHPDCTRVAHSKTVPITDFGPRHPVGDSCLSVVLHCTFEEDVREARTNLRWFEATSGSTLFHITRDAVSSDQLLNSSAGGEWVKTGALEDTRTHGMIPVSLNREYGGLRHTIPRKILLELKYFQFSKGQKRLVEANLYYEELCTTQLPELLGGSTSIKDMMLQRGIEPCDVDVNGKIKSQGYDLVISYYALGWFDLLNRFELGASVYAVLFALVGTTVCAMGGLIFGINRLLTKLRHLPKFMGLSLVKLVSFPQIQGVAVAMIPYVIVVSGTYFLFSDSALTFPEVHQSWSSWGKVGDEEKSETSMGRLGSALVVLGIYSISRATMTLIPTTRVRRVGTISGLQSDSGNAAAKRAHFIGVCLAIESVLLCLWEFSYSDTFRNNIYLFKLVFQLCQVLLDLAVSFIMKDRLLAAPILVSIQMAELLVTIGARNFVEYTLCFLVEVALLVVQRLFLYPLVHRITILLPRWKLLSSEALRHIGVSRERKQLGELAWKKVNEDIEFRSEGVEPLLFSLSMYTIEKTGVMLLPFMHFLLVLLYTESEMAKSYNINQQELLYYGLFASFLIPWMSVFDSFILSSQELLYGWKVYEYFSYQRLRFTRREHSWNLNAPVDESVARPLQNVDLLCFSSQYYFLLSTIALGFGTSMIGITICLRREYSPLGDPTLPFIVVIVVACCEFTAQLCIVVSKTRVQTLRWSGIWNVVQLQGAMDDVISSKLTIGEGRQEDLEREQRELQAMDSASFRHKFMEKNRPWILHHLMELFTPGTLPEKGPDGQPIIDYVRDVYSNLMHESKEPKKHEGGSVSSDDSSDEDEVRRRRWDRSPLEGNQRLIAQSWIQQARKQCVFRQIVAPIIEKRKEDHCSSCSRSLEQCESLTAGLACNGGFDPAAIDSLMKLFEDSYSRAESSQVLWKSFFLENAGFSTICNVCLDQIERDKLHKQLRPVGYGVPSRPEDISSDDESEDERLFDPVCVSRSSDEGKMMLMWLEASRVRLGGDSNVSVVRQSKIYPDKMNNRKSTKKTRADTQVWEIVDLSEMGRCIMKRWFKEARQSALIRFDQQAENIRSQLQSALDLLDVGEDWAFGELRLNGKALKIEGNQIAKRKELNESKRKTELDTLGLDFSCTTNDIAMRRSNKTMEFEAMLSQLRADSQKKKDLRTLDLNKKMDDLQQSNSYDKEAIASLRSSLKTEMEDEDELKRSKISELTSQFENELKVLDQEQQYTQQSHERDCQLLTDRVRKEYVIQEREWQKNASLWLEKASRARKK